MTRDHDVESGDPEPAVAERLRQFARTRDPRALWPNLTDSASAKAHRAIERVVRAVLAGETRVTLDADGGEAVYALTVAGFTTGTGPLLARWMEDGRVQAPPAVQAALAHQLEHGRRRAARIQQGVLPAFDALLARGITPVVIKGFHTALAYCEEPGVRPMSDVDMVVAPGRIDEAEVALGAANFLPRTPRVQPYQRDWVAANVDPRVFSVERHDVRNRWHLELKESFNRQFPNFVRADLDGERHHVAPIDVAGRRLLAPAQPLLFLVLACQLSSELGTIRLMRLIDLVRVVRADRAKGTLDWDDVLAALQRTGAARFTYPALALAEDLAPGIIDPRVLRAARDASTWGVRHRVDRLAPGGNSLEGTSVIAKFMWAQSPIGVIRSSLDFLTRFTSPSGASQWRAFLRHLTTGALSVSAPDERSQPPKR